MAVFYLQLISPRLNAHIIGKEKRTASVSIPPSSLFPGQLEFTQVKTFVVRRRRVKPAPLCLQREAQLHHTSHQVTPCLIKISVAKLSPLKISSIVISAAYRQIGEGLSGEKKYCLCNVQQLTQECDQLQIDLVMSWDKTPRILKLAVEALLKNPISHRL